MERRTFLAALPIVFAGPMAFRQNPHDGTVQELTDEEVCKKRFDVSLSRGLQYEPIGDVVVEVGKLFLGTPYLAHALEVAGDERLVVNMRGLDCVSFYENALVIARCLKQSKTSFDQYQKDLLFIRYRGGKIDGYASRLHYTSDYFFDNDAKKVWRVISKEAGGIRFDKPVTFMSTHPDAYRQIRESEEVLDKIIRMEKEINARETYYIPKDRVPDALPFLRNGDILGFTTSIEGLDTSHTGILVKEHGTTRVLHAPLSGGKVVLSDETLPDYLDKNSRMTGLIAARPLDP